MTLRDRLTKLGETLAFATAGRRRVWAWSRGWEVSAGDPLSSDQNITRDGKLAKPDARAIREITGGQDGVGKALADLALAADGLPLSAPCHPDAHDGSHEWVSLLEHPQIIFCCKCGDHQGDDRDVCPRHPWQPVIAALERLESALIANEEKE